MNNKKIRKQFKEAIYNAGLEHIQQNYYPVYESIKNKQPDNMEEKSVLDCKCEEATRNELEMKKRQLYETGCQQRKLDKYKKELEKERKARKKAVEEQQDLKYLVKNLQNHLKEVEKYCHSLDKKQQKNYKKLKDDIKKNKRKQRMKFNYIKNILGIIVRIIGIPYYGEDLKEIEKGCKEKIRYIKKDRMPYIDCSDYKEIL